jgi:predicted CopG family antitoxin
MFRTQILLELEQHKLLTEIARREKRSLSDVVREMVDDQLAKRKQALLADYENDKDLTAFQALDGEDFHA